MMLKEQFIKCEKKPSSDTECQQFKVKFCTAYPNFNCCTEVLQGRTCKSKSVNRRTYLLDLVSRYLVSFHLLPQSSISSK